MKLTPAAALLLLAAPLAQAQTKTSTTHHTPARTTAKPVGACSADSTQPTLPLTVPKVAGCSKPLYSLRYIDTVVGTGATITPRKWLTVNYTGYLTDGTKFDSSIGAGPDGKPKEPITFPYGAHQVITGWDTGFEGMAIGGKRRLFIPYQLAYGESGRPPVIPAKAELVFDVELLAISDNPPAPKTPPTPPAPTAPPAGSAPVTPPATPPSTTPGAGTKPAADGAKPAAPAPTTDPTKPTTVPPKQ